VDKLASEFGIVRGKVVIRLAVEHVVVSILLLLLSFFKLASIRVVDV
jgi:hypothetical protein